MVSKGKRRSKPCLKCNSRAGVSRGDCARCLKLFWAGSPAEQAQWLAQGWIAEAGKPGRPLQRRKLAKAKR
jgi:hypothetical protein